ncbi:hypothetical protein [Pseudanabaena sp. BC1403]|nr:hypothetical protein [Pseudanabaena sp. BC1403]
MNPKIVTASIAAATILGFIFKEVLRSRSQAVFLHSTMAIAIILS